jgi:hypothetical protein
LPDFSYTGYRAGEAKIPAPPARWNLKRDFGARGDGRTDDSQALLNAVRSIKAGVLYIPKGTYVIARRIDISRGNLILRGAGPKETILYFPNSLTNLFGNTFNAARQSQWSFRPGLINVTGTDHGRDASGFGQGPGQARRESLEALGSHLRQKGGVDTSGRE